jgi:hypothetical protein
VRRGELLIVHNDHSDTSLGHSFGHCSVVEREEVNGGKRERGDIVVSGDFGLRCMKL